MYLVLTVLASSALAPTARPSSNPPAPAGATPSTFSTPSAFYWGDYDGDGLADAYVLGEGPARLLKNLGDGRFTDVTDATGLTLASAGARAHMALWADYDGDGRLDLYLPARTGGSPLLRQGEGGIFEVATQHAGLPEDLDPTSAQWLDYDGDRRPDLLVAHAGIERLFHNAGDGLFEEVEFGLPTRPFAPGVSALPPAPAPAVDDAGPSTTRGAAPSPEGLATSSAVAPSGSLDPSPFCATTIQDVATGLCVRASSVPTAGRLYPLGNEFFIDGAGYVGLSTLTPGAKLDVVGGDIRTTGRLISTAGSGAPLSVASSDLVPNLNADRLDGFHATSFSMLGNSIGNSELENGSVDGNKLTANAVQSVHIFPDTINSLDIATGGVLSDEIGDSTILNVDINPLAGIAGTKIAASFGTQTVQSNGGSFDPAMKGVGVNGPTNGYLGVQGTTDFDGVAQADWAGLEIGVAGISVGASTGDNYGVAGLGSYAGVRGQGDAFGVQGLTTVDTAVGVYGANTSTNGFSYGVMGELSTPGSTGAGVRGLAPFYGVLGETTDNGVSVLGLSTSQGIGVYGRGQTGLLGDSQSTSGSGVGVYGTTLSTAGRGVHGQAIASTGTTDGVLGESASTSGRGVYGLATAASGITYGVWGVADSSAGRGVRGEATHTAGVNYGVQGRTHSLSGWGVISYGSSGTTGQKNFIQPHPSDPGKEIHFFSLEGNESGTYFRGTDRVVNGRAVVAVPEEFRLASAAEGLSVQLTPVGAPALLWIESRDLHEIVVRSSQDVEFDYTVNGLRRGFERVEVMAQNHAFVPEELGVPYGTQYPESYRNLLVQNGILNPDYTPNEVTAERLGWQLAAPLERELRAEESPALQRAREMQVPVRSAPQVGSLDQD